MPIPTVADHKLAEVEQLAALVSVALQTLRFSPAGDIRQVRTRLQAYADAVMETAHDLVQVE
jgi:hypothetical protein